tara:strand:- start:746 stop:1090 length:345 start_codon:yes stop_codon:yes gene_type:complete
MSLKSPEIYSVVAEDLVIRFIAVGNVNNIIIVEIIDIVIFLVRSELINTEIQIEIIVYIDIVGAAIIRSAIGIPMPVNIRIIIISGFKNPTIDAGMVIDKIIATHFTAVSYCAV